VEDLVSEAAPTHHYLCFRLFFWGIFLSHFQFVATFWGFSFGKHMLSICEDIVFWYSQLSHGMDYSILAIEEMEFGRKRDFNIAEDNRKLALRVLGDYGFMDYG